MFSCHALRVLLVLTGIGASCQVWGTDYGTGQMGSKLSYGTRHLMWDVNWGSRPPSLLPQRFPHQPRLIGVRLFSFDLWCASVRIRVLREKVRLLAVGVVEGGPGELPGFGRLS